MTAAGTRKPRVRALTIYLLKEFVSEAEDSIEPAEEVRGFDLDVGGVAAKFFLNPSRVALPAWFSFFEGKVDVAQHLVKSASSAAVLVFPVAGRWFAVTFGYGRNMLRQGVWEANFGLKVTLNAIDDRSIRSIDRKSFDAIARHTREEASRAGSIEQFGLSVEEDLLRAVVGTPEDTSLGRRLAGMDALTTNIAVRLADLPRQIEGYLHEWGRRRYQARYPWIDHVAEIRDRGQARELDERLVRRMAADDLENIWLAVPVPVEWAQVGGFRFSEFARAETDDDIDIRRFLESVRDRSNLSPETLRRRYVYCVDPDESFELHKWSIYQCVYAEIRDGDDVFLLTGGHWYRVAPSFVQRVDGDVGALQATAYELPSYRHRSEEDYNQAVADRDQTVALMDRKNIRYGGGASQIEFCDLVVGPRTFLHVKRYGGSSVLSHLFAQGLVSATLFLQDPDFRRQVRSKLDPSFQGAIPDTQPDARDYEIGFAIVSRVPGSLVLPFFSKVNLRNAVRTLKGLGYRVTLTKIETVQDN